MTLVQEKNKARKKRFRRLKKCLTWLVVLAIAAAIVRFFVLPSLEAEATTTYEKYAAMRGDISNSLSFSGSVSVINNETISSSAPGTVRQIYVSEEDQVVEGQKLMRLSSGETLKASFAGQVNEISAEIGDEVGANTNLIQIVDFNNMKVTMRVDEYSISDVAVGQKCTVLVKALNTRFESEISHINRISSSSGSTAYYNVTAQLSVPDAVLQGMAVTVTIPQESASDVVILSKDALSFDRFNSAYVLMDDGTGTGAMKQVPVEIGVDNDNYVEIRAGLSEGDVVYAVKKEESMFDLFSNLMGGGMNRSGGMGNYGGRNGMNGGYGGMPGGG